MYKEEFLVRDDFGENLKKNLIEGRMLDSEWRKNFRMRRDSFKILAGEVRSYIEPKIGPRGLDVSSVEKQLAITLYLPKGPGLYQHDR